MDALKCRRANQVGRNIGAEQALSVSVRESNSAVTIDQDRVRCRFNKAAVPGFTITEFVLDTFALRYIERNGEQVIFVIIFTRQWNARCQPGIGCLAGLEYLFNVRKGLAKRSCFFLGAANTLRLLGSRSASS